MKTKVNQRNGGVRDIAPQTEAVPRIAGLLNAEAPPLFKIKKILVPMDFSECSKKALIYAIAFARQFAASVDVLHVVPPYYALDPYGVAEYERVEKELRSTAEQRLAKLVLDVVPQQVPVEIYVRTGRAAEEIVDAARELECDVIIVSTHGRGGLKHVLLGSTSETVVRHAPCPVLTVRETEHEFIAN